jgi:vacuolar-type H+-ATPase subunit H
MPEIIEKPKKEAIKRCQQRVTGAFGKIKEKLKKPRQLQKKHGLTPNFNKNAGIMTGVMMVAEKLLLQQIREKELMLNIKIEETRKEAEEIILAAKKEASEMIEKSEREGEKAARAYYETEMKKIQQEVEKLRNQAGEHTMSLQMKGEQKLQSAVDRIVKAISME